MNLKRFGINVLVLTVLLTPFLSFAQIDFPGQGNPVEVTTPASSPSPSSQSTFPNPLKVDTISQLISLVLNSIVLPIGGMVAVGYIIYAGFILVTAQGNPKQIEEGKKAFYNACIGTAILLGAVAIADVVKNTICSLSTTICTG